ncbi:expressed unknown protein [Seminavis robusta]|uniref:Hydroxyproline O-arabinosyltransferase-like domain-containing protein n=1 Tax=Seminavis robusta TaxID=568900 RepID=A0A9N8H6G8_9STRA|nr:expressed unknown protein [Seminavis robusta]|eukprot:Sro99_g051060.1 n/a (480) ;mRNA; r:108583-110180
MVKKLVLPPSPQAKRQKAVQAFLLTSGLLICFSFWRLVCSSSSSDAMAAEMLLFSNMTKTQSSNIRLSTAREYRKYDRFDHLKKKDPAYHMNSLPAPTYHLVISTGCSTFQDWQSYVMFFHAVKSGQVRVSDTTDNISYVTRVASGCSDDEALQMDEIHRRDIAPMAPGRFFLHHTPEYKYSKPGIDYKFFNKPMGYRHWMSHALRYPYNHDKYDNVTTMGWPLSRQTNREPFAQEYAFGVQFFNGLKMDKIAQKTEIPSRVSKLDLQKEAYSYMVGPPYIMKGYDLWRIISKWAEFVTHVYEQVVDNLKPEHLSEMYSYSIASAHLGLKHAVAHSFMVSNVDIMAGEAWSLIDNKDGDDLCDNFPPNEMPHVLHHCQFYSLGNYFFSKYHLPGDFISCESPLLVAPPSNFSKLYNYAYWPHNQEKRLDYANNPLKIKRNAFAVCHMIKSMNEAAIYYKQQHCNDATANYNRTLTLPVK